MFERVSRAAERLATGVSRRQFLGRVGRAAAAVAGVLAGVGVLTGTAQAGGGGCGPASIGDCANKPYGSPCFAGFGWGRCVSSPHQVDSDGNKICNVCRIKNKDAPPDPF